MRKPVENTSSRDDIEMVEVKGSTKAENSSHQARKRSQKAVGSSDQTKTPDGKKRRKMKSLREIEDMKPQLKVLEDTAEDMRKQVGSAEFASYKEEVNSKFADFPQTLETIKAILKGLKNANKKVESLVHKFLQNELTVGDLKNMGFPWDTNFREGENTLREIEEMKPQLKVLEDRVEDMLKQIGNAEFVTHKEKVKSEFAAISQNLEAVKADLEGVKNDFKKMESLSAKFFQKELTEDDWMNMETITGDLLHGEKNLMPDSEYPQDFFDMVGMSKQEIMAEFEESKRENKRCYEELKRENKRCYEELKRENEELKRENEELKGENKKLNSRVTAIETDKGKNAKK